MSKMTWEPISLKKKPREQRELTNKSATEERGSQRKSETPSHHHRPLQQQEKTWRHFRFLRVAWKRNNFHGASFYFLWSCSVSAENCFFCFVSCCCFFFPDHFPSTVGRFIVVSFWLAAVFFLVLFLLFFVDFLVALRRRFLRHFPFRINESASIQFNAFLRRGFHFASPFTHRRLVFCRGTALGLTFHFDR